VADSDLSGRLTWGRGPRLALTLVAGITAVGTVGYMVIEGWSAWDAFYMTIISVTTVGYGYPRQLTRGGEIWTTLVLLAGVSALFYTASLVMALMVEGGLYRRIEARRFTRMLETLTDHYIICGYGRIGSIIAEEFRKQNIPYVVVDRDPERVHQVLQLGGMAVQADASREDVLSKVGIARARGLIAAVGTDAENVYAVLTARVLRSDLFIIARVESPDAEAKLRRAGANRVISPYQLGGIQMAQTALRPAVVDFMRLATSSSSIDLAAEQVAIGGQSRLVGQTIRGADLRQSFGVVVVAIQRAAGQMEFNPAPESVMAAGDQLVVLGHPDQLKTLDRFAKGRDGAET
jgi:voltage-gated potassium channel